MSNSPKPARNHWYPKALTFSAIGMGVGFGTCVVGQGSGGGLIGAVVFVISLLGLISTSVAALVMYVAHRFRK
jgi:hypothetical protein